MATVCRVPSRGVRCAQQATLMKTRIAILLAIIVTAAGAAMAQTNAPLLELNKLPFFLGRDYFVLRSGRAQMIVQADRADLGPAFTYLLFDALQAHQSARKEGALNFTPGQGFADSALAVELGGFPFTALGHRTETRWVKDDGIPSVEAVWWAGGVRVTERIAALDGEGVYRRTIRLEGAHLIGPEQVSLRLALPPGERQADGAVLAHTMKGADLALAVAAGVPARALAETGTVEIGPLSLGPNSSLTVRTFLLAQIPARSRQALVDRAKLLLSDPVAPEVLGAQKRWAATASVSTRDAVVQEIFDKARFGLPGMIADDGTMDAGIFEYGMQWVRDTSCTAIGALHAGHFEAAHATLVRMLTKMVSKDGVTMIAGAFDPPDREQFDQMGELLHLLRAYRDWTGDDSLVHEHRDLLLAMIERPLQPQFRDDTGMVHNRREFWERTLDDAYELAYQTYLILGLREAAELAPALGAAERAVLWRAEADRIEKAMLSHPTRALVHGGCLIKRRNVTGEIADQLASYSGYLPDVPGTTETHHRLLPDASMALPIALGVVNPRSDLARRTLDQLEGLWNTRWSDGGYDRYHTSSQPDQPGPWPFATAFVLRAQHDAGLFDRSRRSLEWLNTMAGGRSGCWFEEIPSNRSQAKACGLVCWTSGEMALFVLRHYLGVGFASGGQLLIKPALYPGSPPLSADLRFRQARLRLEIDGSGPVKEARVNGQKLKVGADGTVRLSPEFKGGKVEIRTQRKWSDRPQATP